ncbi:MAG: hypothetical protein PHH28_17180, partial [Desulfuromonadaceae bacterium]|nr:hypothetical protein [Desulfuromonadaceae bacterium]
MRPIRLIPPDQAETNVFFPRDGKTNGRPVTTFRGPMEFEYVSFGANTLPFLSIEPAYVLSGLKAFPSIYGNRSVRGVFDIRGLGGQVLCPGSLHPETRKPYVISKLADIVEAPNWLLNYSLHKSVHPKNASPSVPKILTEVPTMTSSPSTPQLNDPLVANLPVSDEIKQMILAPFPKGQRSEPSMAVLVGLLSANVDEKTVL